MVPLSDPNKDPDRVSKNAARSPVEKEMQMISTIDSPFTEQMGTEQAGANLASSPFPELSQQLEKDLVQVFKLLADETRLKILMGLLREGEMHVSAMCDMLNQSQPAVSHHLALLRVAGIIEPRRDGKHNFYSVCQDRFHLLMGELFSTISDPKRDEFRFKSFVVTKDE